MSGRRTVCMHLLRIRTEFTTLAASSAECSRDPRFPTIPGALPPSLKPGHFDPTLRRWSFSFVIFFALFPEFPLTPWLQIDSSERKRRLADFVCGLKPLKLAPLAPVVKGSSTCLGAPSVSFKFFDDLIAVELVEFTISWAFTDAEILERFAAWLKATRTTPEPEKRLGKKLTQPDVLRVRLRELGAKRLLENITLKKADAHTKKLLLKETGENISLHGTSRSWLRAKKNAEALLDAFGEDGLPICDTDGPRDLLAFMLGTSKSEMWKTFLSFREGIFPMTDRRWSWWYEFQREKGGASSS